MSLVTWNGKLLLTNGKLTLGPAADECCCVGTEGCEAVPDDLELQIDYCGHTWTFPMVKSSDYEWTTACKSWTDCRGGLCAPGVASNYYDCFRFLCIENQFYLQAHSSCDPSASAGNDCTGLPTNWGVVQHYTADPFTCIWDDSPVPFLNGVCCDTYPDDPPCGEIPVFTVRIP